MVASFEAFPGVTFQTKNSFHQKDDLSWQEFSPDNFAKIQSKKLPQHQKPIWNLNQSQNAVHVDHSQLNHQKSFVPHIPHVTGDSTVPEINKNNAAISDGKPYFNLDSSTKKENSLAVETEQKTAENKSPANSLKEALKNKETLDTVTLIFDLQGMTSINSKLGEDARVEFKAFFQLAVQEFFSWHKREIAKLENIDVDDKRKYSGIQDLAGDGGYIVYFGFSSDQILEKTMEANIFIKEYLQENMEEEIARNPNFKEEVDKLTIRFGVDRKNLKVSKLPEYKLAMDASSAITAARLENLVAKEYVEKSNGNVTIISENFFNTLNKTSQYFCRPLSKGILAGRSTEESFYEVLQPGDKRINYVTEFRQATKLFESGEIEKAEFIFKKIDEQNKNVGITDKAVKIFLKKIHGEIEIQQRFGRKNSSPVRINKNGLELVGKRENERIETDAKILAEIHGKNLEVWLNNISKSGVAIAADDFPANIGENLNLILPGMEQKFAAKVVRRAGKVVGIQFEKNLPEEVILKVLKL
jgi:hypothetical protein